MRGLLDSRRREVQISTKFAVLDYCSTPKGDWKVRDRYSSYVLTYAHAFGISSSHLRVMHLHCICITNRIAAGDPRLRVARSKYLTLDDNKPSRRSRKQEMKRHNEYRPDHQRWKVSYWLIDAMSAVLVCTGLDKLWRNSKLIGFATRSRHSCAASPTSSGPFW